MISMLAVIAVCSVAGYGLWTRHDIERRRLAEAREARIAASVDEVRLDKLKHAIETLETRFETSAEKWNTTSLEVSAMSGRRKS